MQTIGILGAGQLGRMLALAGYPLGLRFRFLDPVADGPASRLAPQLVAAYDDQEALRHFAVGLDLVTYEFENVPLTTAHTLATLLPLFPPPAALAAAQDRLSEKQFFASLGIATAPFLAIGSRAALFDAARALGLPALLKTRRMGYDGKGQALLRRASDLDSAWELLGAQPLILESYVPFERELSILAARGRDGATAYYPLVENYHEGGVLRRSLAPAPGVSATLQHKAEALAGAVLLALDYVGLLAIELFEADGRLLANEMAPRVHNSGHWTIEGAATSQFEQHLRAILGLPLGSTAAHGWSAMGNLLGELPEPSRLLAVPGAHMHCYDKLPQPGRKLGHVTVVATTLEAAEDGLQKALARSPALPFP